MAAARSETDREVTSQQLDAFHKTFNFCMTCRQYTCGNCWNEAEGRCLTCAPHLGHEILPAPFPDLPGERRVAAGGRPTARTGTPRTPPRWPRSVEALAWPTMDLERDRRATDADGRRRAEPIDAGRRRRPPGARLGATSRRARRRRDRGDRAADADGGRGGRRSDVAEPTRGRGRGRRRRRRRARRRPVAAEPGRSPRPPRPRRRRRRRPDRPRPPQRTNELMQRFRPGQSLDDEIEAYEREQAAPDAATPGRWPPSRPPARSSTSPTRCPQPRPRRPQPSRVERRRRRPSPSPSSAEPRPWPPTARGRRRAADLADHRARSRGDAARSTRPRRPHRSPQPPPPAPSRSGRPSPSGRASDPPPGCPSSIDRPQPTGGIEALWAESAREVASPIAPGRRRPRSAGGVQPCVSCGLSLSATARFCRRCGTRQG